MPPRMVSACAGVAITAVAPPALTSAAATTASRETKRAKVFLLRGCAATDDFTTAPVLSMMAHFLAATLSVRFRRVHNPSTTVPANASDLGHITTQLPDCDTRRDVSGGIHRVRPVHETGQAGRDHRRGRAGGAGRTIPAPPLHAPGQALLRGLLLVRRRALRRHDQDLQRRGYARRTYRRPRPSRPVHLPGRDLDLLLSTAGRGPISRHLPMPRRSRRSVARARRATKRIRHER